MLFRRLSASAAAILLLASGASASTIPLPESEYGDGPWGMDFTLQSPDYRPPLEVRYTGPDRQAFEVLAAGYHLVGDLRPPYALRHASSGEVAVRIDVADRDGTVWSTAHAASNARINLFRRGPYYSEVRFLDIRVGDGQGAIAPIRGDLALHCWPTHIHATLTWRVGEGEEFALQSARIHGVDDEIRYGAVRPGQPQSNWFPIIRDPWPPLPPEALETLDALEPLRYDERLGCYVIGSHNPGGFQEHFYHHPNGYERAAFRIRNDGVERLAYILHETASGNAGSVEGGAVLDAAGRVLPIRVQISKNFSGEDEEPFFNPGDPAFSETFFPLHLQPGEAAEVESLHLYQNWGRKPVKQFSSLGAWMDYFHSSTGVTETTCYVPFKYMNLQGIDLADLRAMSQDFWSGQPQHDNIAGHWHMAYTPAGRSAKVHAEYRGTDYRSTGNNWFDVTLSYLTEDGRLEVRMDAWESPQRDELRSYFTLRVHALGEVRVDNAPELLELLAVTSRIQRLRYTHLAASGHEDQAIDFSDPGVAVRGLALDGPPWFAGLYGEPKGQNGFVLTRWEAPFSPAATVRTLASGDTVLLITAAEEQITIPAGTDMLIEGFMFPWGDIDTAEPMRVEAARAAAHSFEVRRGAKLRDFPPAVRLDDAGRAEFVLAGGFERLPVLVEGPFDWRGQILERREGRRWVPVRHNFLSAHDGREVQPLGGGDFREVFLPYLDEAPMEFRVRPGTPSRGRSLAAAPQPPAEGAFRSIALSPHPNAPSVRLDFASGLGLPGDWSPDPVRSGTLTGGWVRSEGDSWWFEESRGGLDVGGRVTLLEGEAELEFWIGNNGQEPIEARGAMAWTPQFDFQPGEAFVRRDGRWIAFDAVPAYFEGHDQVMIRQGGRWIGVAWNTDLNTRTPLQDATPIAADPRRARAIDGQRRYYARGKAAFSDAPDIEDAWRSMRLGL